MLRIVKQLTRALDDWIHESWGPIRVLFPIGNMHGFACQEPIIRALEGNQGFRVAITKEHSSVRPEFDTREQNDLFDRYYIPVEKAIWGKWHYVIHSDTSDMYFPRGGVRAIIAHGPAFGNTDYAHMQANRPNIDLVFGLSRAEYPYHISRDSRMFDDRAFIPLGFPKLDRLLSGGYSREETLALLGLPVGRKTVLIASHWTPSSLLRTFRSRVLQCLTGDYNVIQTGHPTLWENPERDNFNPQKKLSAFDSCSLWDELVACADGRDGVCVTRTSNVHSLLNVADILVTDGSSVMVEYCGLDRPILFFDHPDRKFVDPVSYELYRSASHPFESLDGLPEKCHDLLENGDGKSEERKKMLTYFLANPGCSSLAAKELLVEMGRVSGRHSTNWKRVRAVSEICL